MAFENYTNAAQTTLTSTITAGATSISVAGAGGFPTGSGQFRILIDSEIILVTGGQGTTTWTVTRAADSTIATTHNILSTVTHVLSAQSLLNLYFFDVRAYGVKADGSDDATAIINALAAAAPVNGIVFMPPGNYRIGSQIIVPYGVELLGCGRSSTTITALNTFPTSKALVQLGALGSIGVGCRIRGVAVDCNNVSGSTGIYSEGINENSGAYECMVRNYGSFGVQIKQTSTLPQNFSIDDVEIFSGTGTGAGAIALSLLGTATMPFREVSRITVFATGSTQLTTAIKLDATSGGLVKDCHIENAVNGILVGSLVGCFGTSFINISGNNNVTNLLVWSNATSSQNLIAIGVVPQNSTNSIVDQITGNTLTAEQAIYAQGNGAVNQRSIISTDGALGTRLTHLTVSHDLKRSYNTPGEANVVSGVDASNAEIIGVTLTANRVVGLPVNPATGQRLTFTFLQDGTGGRTVGWNAVFKVSWSDAGNTSNKRSTISFLYDGTNWNQDGAQTPYV